jgi:hypothetical protein
MEVSANISRHFDVAVLTAVNRMHGASYYVATNGVNTNPGTLASPYLAIQKAASVMVAGDTCYVRGGTYRETVTPANSGTAGSRITYQNYSNEVVIISGADPLPGWSNYSGSIWVANMAANWFSRATAGDGSRLFDPLVGNEADLILCDSQLMPLARWPNTSPGCTNLFDLTRPAKSLLTAFVSKTNDANSWTIGVFGDTALPQLGDNGYTGAEIVLQPNDKAWSWTLSGYISASTNRAGGGTTLTLRSPNSGGADGNSAVYPVNSRYWLWNKLQFLDAAGEWFHDKPAGKLYLWAPDGTSPEGRVEARKRRFAFNLNSRNYIIVRGFKLVACSITTDTSSGGDNIGYNHTDGVISNPVTPRYPWRGAGSVGGSTGCLLENLDVNYPTWYSDVSGHFYLQWGQSSGVVLSGQDHILRNSVIHNSAGNGVTLLGRRNRVQDCLIENVACMPTDTSGVQMGQATVEEDHEIARNTIRNCGRSGITPRSLICTVPTDGANDWKARIHHNDISAFGMQDWDTGGIYSFGNAGWTRVDHNWVHSVHPDVDSRTGNGAYTASGIYYDYGQNVVIDHNAVWDVEWGVHLQNTDTNGASPGNYLCYNNTVLVKRTATSVTYGPFGFVENSAATHSGTVISNNLIACAQSLANYKAIDDFPLAAKGKNVSTANGTAGYLSSLGLNLQGGSVYPDALYPTASSSSLVNQASLMGSLVRNGITVPAYNDPVSGVAADIGAFEYGLTAWTAGITNKFQASILFSNLTQTYNGTAKVATATTLPPGLAVTLTYNGDTNGPTNAGSYTVIATVVDSVYQGSATNTLVINPAAATVTLGSLSQTYDGTARSASATTTPGGLTVNLTYNGSVSAPTNAGNYSVIGTVTNANYFGSATNTLVVAPKVIGVTADAKSKTYGGSDPVLTYQFTPALAAGDSFSGALSRVAGEAVGSYAINQGTLTLSTNYTLNYTGANLVIHAPIRVSMTDMSLAGEVLTLSLSGVPGATYVTQNSTNLNGPWLSFVTNTPLGGTWTVVVSTSKTSEFFRVVYP